MEEMDTYKNDTFFCPVFEGEISDYDCGEISCGARNGYYLNDGLPYLMPIETVISRKKLCEKCMMNQNNAACADDKKLNEAIRYATEKHAGQKRKGTDIPYIVHPLETMITLSAMNANNQLLIAGVLHDVVEDTDATIKEISELFGTDVAALVDAHSEDKSKTWKERKETDIRKTKEGSRSLKMLVMADKVSNLRSLYRDFMHLKEQVWTRFHAPENMQAWYYSEMIDALDDMQSDADTADAYGEMVSLFQDVFAVYDQDIRDAEYAMFTSERRDLSIKIYDKKLVFQGEDFGEQCKGICGRKTYEFFYNLDAEQTLRFLGTLRKKYDRFMQTEDMLKQEFGYEDGSVRFETYCRENNIPYDFFSF